MKNKNMVKLIFVFFSFLCFLFCLFLIYTNILYPAQLSLKVDCNKISIVELKDLGYYVGGFYNSSENKITITNETYIYASEFIGELQKHEKCHQVQFSQNRLANCNHKLILYLNEVECYIAQKLPDSFYNKIYG